jgi:cellulose synthase/poly-beta-1,6-N-acetylglucosamine synthase-like glycosyltransferase
LLEVIVVDDRSTDKTQAIVSEFSKNHPNITLLVSSPPDGHLRGKANAVAQGIEVSKGEILFFTDADCVAQKRWVQEVLKYYADENVGIVAGFTSLRASNWFECVQALDWLVLFSVAAATIKLHFPVTAVGNNLSVRRKAYDLVGGYHNLPFSVTEDYVLFHAITSKTKYTARFPLDTKTLVESGACKTWRDLYDQRKRWFRGGRDLGPARLFVFGVIYVFHLLVPASLLTVESAIVWIALLMKVTVDFVLLVPAMNISHRWNLIKYFLPFELYYIFYVLAFPIITMFGKEVVWKEQTFGRRSDKQKAP